MSNIIEKIKHYLGNRRDLEWALCLKLGKSKISHLIPDKLYLRIQHRGFIGRKLNLNNPETFNEKLQWLKIYNRKPIQKIKVDKYEVKKYVADTIGSNYIIPTLGVWESFDDIDFNTLPTRFVLKCTHDSGSIVICKDKENLDFNKARAKLNKGISTESYYWGREWPYKGLVPRIIAEKYLEEQSTGKLEDYKFFCFNGKVKCFKIDFDRFSDHHANYYDTDGNLLPFGEIVCTPNYNRQLQMPQHLQLMISLAEQLSCNEPFVRIDFYESEGKVYFGEITYYPAAGFGPFIPDEWDYTLGSWINLRGNGK